MRSKSCFDMITDLHIENIAVIERADVRFGPAFNVLTGETGAGKSILIDAIDAVLGGRASRELVRSGAERALISAVFTDAHADAWLAENEIDCDDGELDGRLDVGDVGVGFEAHDLPALGVDGVELSLEARVEHVLYEHSAEFGHIVGSTDDGYRLGV